MQKTHEVRVCSLGREDPLEKEMATHSSILAWRIPWTEEPGGLQFMWLQESDACMRAKSLQSCSTLCGPMDCSPPGSSVHGILQTRILEWVAMPSSKGSSQPRDQTQVSASLAAWFFTTSATWETHESESHSVVSDSLRPHGLYSPWNSPGQNTGASSFSLLQGIFPSQGLNPGLVHCRQILYQLSHKASTRILEWVAYPFSSGSSPPRNQTGVSCIAGGFFTN